MLGKRPNKVYDPFLKAGLGYQNPKHLKKAIAAQPKMYDGERLHSMKLIINSHDSEETLEDAEEIRLKMKNKMIQLNYAKSNDLYETFVPQKDFSAEQTYFLNPFTSNVSFESSKEISDLPTPKMPNENSKVKRALFTSHVVEKSRNLGATYVVAKSKFSVAKTPTTKNKDKDRESKENPKTVDDDDENEKKDGDDKKDDDNDDHTKHTLVRDQEMGSMETRKEKIHTPISSPTRPPRKNLSSDKTLSRELTKIVSPSNATTSKAQHKTRRISSKYNHIPGVIHRMCIRQGYMIQCMGKKYVGESSRLPVGNKKLPDQGKLNRTNNNIPWVIDLKLCYNTLRFKEGETLTQTFIRYKALMNELVNDRIKISKNKINTGFINGLPKKWLSFCQILRNTNHVKDSELASLFCNLKYEENLIDSIYGTKKKKSLISATPLSISFFSTSIVQDFQDSRDEEEDTKSSQEYMDDLEEEYQARALLAKSKRFFKREEVSSDDNEMVEVKVLMALAEDNDVVSKEVTKNGEWVKISIIKAKDLVFVKSSSDDTKVSIPGVERPWLFEVKVPAKGNKSVSTSKVNLDPAGKLKNVKIEDDPPLAIVMKELNNLKLQISKNQSSYSRNNQPQQVGSSLRSRTLRPSKHIFSPCIHYGFSDHLSNDCVNYPICDICGSYEHDTYGHNKIISLRRGIKPRNPQHVIKSYETCGSTVHTTNDHNDIEWFRRVYIHNHKDHLGKFDEKDDDGYFLGYSLVFKAFGVFNIQRQQNEETYHIIFNESPDAIKFTKHSFDNINIAESERYPPDEYLHPYEPSQRYQTNSNDDIHIELVNIIGDPRARMLTRAMVKELSVALAHECLFVDFLSEEEPKKVSEALKHSGWVDAMQDKLN
nr:retrovirus-related Pol polyprotein from transposon TNT 1-94 [Tanacetum cinerariifolium]